MPSHCAIAERRSDAFSDWKHVKGSTPAKPKGVSAIERDFPVVYVEAIEYQVDFEKITEARNAPGDLAGGWLMAPAGRGR